MIFVGNDWAEDHHDVHVCDGDGAVLATRRLPEGLDGVAAFHQMVAAHVDDPSDVVIGIETDRGLWVQALIDAGYTVYAINPKSASRYRERHTTSGAKSDAGDAKMLADLVRTDRHNHRPVAGDSDRAESVKVLARAHQTLIWDRARATNRLRQALREYYPAALATFPDLDDRDCLVVLAQAPSPEEGKALTARRLRAALKAGGRIRNLDRRTKEIADGLRVAALTAPGPIVSAFRATTLSTVAIITELNTQIAALESELADHFEQHPDADVYLSLPGIAVVLGARALAEFGDDPNRYANAKSRKNYAGTSPITRASGTRSIALARYVRNRRLADAMNQWAICSLNTSPGARAFYDQRRNAQIPHQKALRALANRWVGILHGCLRHHTPYDEHTAWAHRPENDLNPHDTPIAA